MSRKTVWVCDRCNAEYDVAWYQIKGKPASGKPSQPLVRRDLCGMCYSHLLAWLKGES